MNFDLSTLVLVLNANFEPINVCNARRAIGLIVKEKATMVMDGRGVVNSVRASFPIPSIIRLERMIKRPRPVVKLSKYEILRRDSFTCQYCGQRTAHLTLDHVIPRRLGGPHSWENLVTACPGCNHRKGGRTLEQVKMRLHHTPAAPPASANYIFGHYLNAHEEWLDFMEGW